MFATPTFFRSTDGYFRISLGPLLVAVALSGCGGSGEEGLARVKGTVTLDGQPLEGASVVFVPETPSAESQPGYGSTGRNGHYTVVFSNSRQGITPGKYKVSIQTFVAPGEDENGTAIPATPEKVPDVYNRSTTLTAEVPPDGGTFDFTLKTTEGKIVQPKVQTE